MKNYLLNPVEGDFVIFTDGCADLTLEEKQKYGIWPETAPFSISVHEHDVGFAEIGQFYECLADGTYPPQAIKTACPSLADIDSLIERIVAQTPEHVAIYYCSTSPYISSGTVTAHEMMLDAYREQYPKRKFVTIDTTCTSNGQGLMLQTLAQYTSDDLVGYAAEVGSRMMHLFTQREMEFSAKSGRYGALKSAGMVALSKLKLNPFMFFPSDDKLSVHGAMRRGDMILREWVQYFIEHRAALDTPIRIGYGHESERARAEKFVEMLKRDAGVTDDQIQLARVGAAIGAHTGPTVLSFFFLQAGLRPAKEGDFDWKPPKK